MGKKKSRQKTSVHPSSAKRATRHRKRVPEHADLSVPKPEVDRFMGLYEAKRLVEAERAAQAMTQRYPESAFAWKALGTTLLEDGRVEEALEHLHRSVELNDADPLSLTSLAAVYYRQGENDQAVRYQTRAVELQPDYAPARYRLAEMLQSAGKQIQALEHASKAQELGYDAFRSGVLVGSLLYQTKYFSQALDIYKRLERDYPGHAPVYNNLGNLYKDIGQYERSEAYYQRALEQQPDYVMAYSNIFFAKHYNPEVSQQAIIDFAKGWDSRFALPLLAAPGNRRDPAKPLRVGLISSGFRLHPVGQMIATAMEHSRPDVHFYGYTTNDHDDYVTQKIREATRVWRPVRHLGQEALARQIRDDAIDILIDLSGHGDGSCLQAISMRPAPLCVKWVGGLVNTMGLSSIDYLISDAIETPEGVDDQYTEKLIRLPDDYICYMPCPYAPATTSLPAVKNGYVTLGCLNNPAKIGERLLGEWAKLMHELPESRLLLRGPQYESEDFCGWVRDTLAEHGIAEYRVILEGPAKHAEFLETYQRIDIALDTWPYSGGLTTCEAMLMGVPVVTLPGPTFAGRHSATHLINAGLQELVTSSWDEYRQRVLELANDLPNLAVIRAGLRTVLHYSPVCDAPRFANHFNNALRAIWQRHCDDKAPEALTFNKEGAAWFAGETDPVELVEAREEEESENAGFEWQLDSPVVAVDNGAVLASRPDARELLGSGQVAMLSFDPAGRMETVDHLAQYGEIQHFPYTSLGDGQPATLHLGEGVEPATQLPFDHEGELETHEIPTVALDSIEGLPNIDVLALDASHDNINILKYASESLLGTLAIQVKVVFQADIEGQADFSKVQSILSGYGFRFYSFRKIYYDNRFPYGVSLEMQQPSEMVGGEALFIPGERRLESLVDTQKMKLAFLMDGLYGIKDYAYRLISSLNNEKGRFYLEKSGLLSEGRRKEKSGDTVFEVEPCDSDRVVHICFNNMHIQSLVDSLSSRDFTSGVVHHVLISRGRSVAGYDVDIESNPMAFYFDVHKDISRVVKECLKSDVRGVVFHGLFFEWQKEILRSVGRSKKVLWVIWGGDLYNPIKINDSLNDVNPYVDAVATVTDSDYDLFKGWYGGKPSFKFRYVPKFEGLDGFSCEKEKLIVVGNSGDASNCHFEILKSLEAKKDVSEYRIVVPFSYNVNEEYRDELIAGIDKLRLGSSVSLLTNFMSSEEYFGLIARAEAVITAHHRSQAGATLNAAFFFGTEVVLRRKIQVGGEWIANPHWLRMEEMGVSPVDFEGFQGHESVSEALCKGDQDKLKDRMAVVEHRGRGAAMRQLDETINGFLSMVNSRGGVDEQVG